ncbi:MAG TPA: non-canonical purine NTP pyrophosphatase [Burkholderiaceae bacterium]|nr:non-canonical purine NTP pyrophosphatase [Burkholderiaceae bacterium]
MKLVLASNNAKKLAELRSLFAGLPIELIAQGALGVAEAEEPHVTFVENALAKARHAARITGLAAIADDSGLCVDALGGAPGVRSAVYGPAPSFDGDREARRRAQDAANNALLLQRMAGQVDRRCRFVSTLVALRHADHPEPLVAFGRWPATLLDAARGTGGFGYDPLVWIGALGASVAELSTEAKNRVSHRALAAAQMRALMQDVWRLP